MRFSEFGLTTLKEVPAEAEIVSHKLMLRAGLIRRLASGLFTWMPIGLRVLRKVSPLSQMPFRGPGPDRGFHPFPEPETVVGRTSWGLELHIPIGDDTQCWRSELPCIGWPPFDPDLRLRRDGDLASGFVIDRSAGSAAP